MKKINEEGIALLITMLLLGTMIATAFGVAVLTTNQTGITRLIDGSISAVFAADAGMEKVLYVCNGRSLPSYPVANFTVADIGNGAGYHAFMADANGNQTNDCNDTIVKSNGSKDTVRRSFQSEYK